MKNRLSAFVMSPLTAAFLLSLPAYGQTVLDTVEVTAGRDVADPRLPEVTTATRTRTAVRDVPQTINAVSGTVLEAYGQTSLSTALVGVPGVDASGDTRFDSVTVRGFSSGNDLYLDGFRDDMQYSRDLGNVEQVEVLKGPAAVLYGRGAGGGVVNRVSKKPRAGLPSSVSVTYGSHNKRRLQGDFNASLSDAVTVRLNAAQEEYDSFRDGVSGRRKLFAPSLNWRISPSLNWLLQYEYSRHDRTPDRGIPALNGRPADVPVGRVYGDVARDYVDDVAQSFRSRLSLDLNEDWQLRYMMGLIRLDSTFDNTYQTGVSGDKVSRQRWQQDLSAFNASHTVELEGSLKTAAVTHQLLAGVELGYQKRDPKLYQNATAVPAQSIFAPDNSLRYNGAMKVNSDNQHRVDSRAVYLQDQMSLGNWKMLAGLRWDGFAIDSRSRLSGASEERRSHSLSPRLGVVWSPVTEHSVYASWSKSFAPVGGGTIGITPGANGNDLAPEFTRQTEAGVKSDWLAGTLSSSLAVYQLELYNRRTTDPNDPSRVELTGLQRTRGVELTLTGKLSKEWYLRSGAAWQEAELVKAEMNRQGKRPANVSRLNGSLFVGVAPQNGWYAETGITAVGQRYADADNTVLLPGYGRWDARIGWRDRQWDADVALTNLADKRYFSSANSAAQILPGSPRAAQLTARYRF